MSARCLQPVLVRRQDASWQHYSCRQCSNCVKGRKSDYVGRLLLEAQHADHTFAFTNTYADKMPVPDPEKPGGVKPGTVAQPGAERFQKEDWDKFIRSLRDQYRSSAKKQGYLGPEITTPPRPVKRRLRQNVSRRTLADRVRKRKRLEDPNYVPPKRYRGARIRYIRVSEWGEKFTKRHHGHGMLFCEGPKPNWERNRETHKNQLWDVWPHGWSQVDYIPPGQAVSSANYVSKYMLKSAFEGRPPVGFSSRPGLGAAGLVAIAEAYADAGLPLREVYNVENVRMSRGKHKGELRQFRMSGRARDHAFKAHRKRWIERKGSDEKYPQTDFSLRYDPDAVFSKPPQTPKMRWHKRSKCRPSIGRGMKKGVMGIHGPDGRVFGTLHVSGRGVARFSWVKEAWGNEIVRGNDLRHLFEASEAEHDRIAKWLADCRGPNWIDYDDYVSQRREARKALESELRRSEIAGMAAIHDPVYFKKRDVLRNMKLAAGITDDFYKSKKKPKFKYVSPEAYARRHPDRCRPVDLSLEPDPKAAAP